MGGRRRGPEQINEQVDFGEAELVRDPDRPNGWTLLLDGTPQSYVETSQPTWLEFEYVRQLGAVVDLLAPARDPLHVLHLGAGALTLPRYIAATRPGSVQRVVERDAALIALVRRVLPPPRGADLRVRTGDARQVVESTRADRFDLVVNDVYSGARMPGRLTSTEFVAEVARVLRPGGWYAANLADRKPLSFARSQAATLRAVFDQVCVIAEPGTLRGRRFGNLVLVATDRGRLPVAKLTRRVAAEAFPARVLDGEELDRFIAGAPPVTDQGAADSPEPPRSIFSSR
ncbi:fused MFS/spermidine synthase [Natronosporangium hydrolyticum]|uniref:Fused MFS/spermidine synthase n=1 Tax=Natronosporangium hydrolyticum TaxID=2811111 RepID=A0A895YGQ2_9ACTN|nr:fused MFS/spermidine synthase [Natronosporangium hydrolyticum]QSB16997.1 fused MFS/spermidine synthase [Natronosporangium hydrolyticum]